MNPKRIAQRLLPGTIQGFLRDGRRLAWRLAEYGLQRVPPDPVCESVSFVQTAPISARFLLATSSGLLLYDSGHINRIISGYFYGVSRFQNRWYGFHKHVTRYTQRPIGQIVSFELSPSQPRNISLEVRSLDASIHQLDAWDHHLYVTDTANNRIIRYTITENGLADRRDYYPNGRLYSGKDSDNYVHLNSVFSRNGTTYVVYHNHTTNTGRESQIAILDRHLEVQGIIDLHAGDAHNVALHPSGFMYCDSRGGTFVRGESVLDCGCFTRGLAVAQDFVLVGGSDWAEKDERGRTTGYVYVFDREDDREIARLRLPGVGSVYEIRLVEPADMAMSWQAGSA